MPTIYDNFTDTHNDVIQNGTCFHMRGRGGSLGATLSVLYPRFDQITDWAKGKRSTDAIAAFRAAGFIVELRALPRVGAKMPYGAAVYQPALVPEGTHAARRCIFALMNGQSETNPA